MLHYCIPVFYVWFMTWSCFPILQLVYIMVNGFSKSTFAVNSLLSSVVCK